MFHFIEFKYLFVQDITILIKVIEKLRMINYVSCTVGTNTNNKYPTKKDNCPNDNDTKLMTKIHHQIEHLMESTPSHPSNERTWKQKLR